MGCEALIQMLILTPAKPQIPLKFLSHYQPLIYSRCRNVSGNILINKKPRDMKTFRRMSRYMWVEDRRYAYLSIERCVPSDYNKIFIKRAWPFVKWWCMLLIWNWGLWILHANKKLKSLKRSFICWDLKKLWIRIAIFCLEGNESDCR